MSRPRPSVVALVALVCAAATGCASGFDATARQDYAPGDGVQGSSGTMRVLNALVVAPEDGDRGVVVMAVVNDGLEDDEITGVESDAGTVELNGSTDIGAGETLLFSAGTDTTATVEGLTAVPGEAVTLDVTFANARPIELRTVVVPATGDYETVTPEAEPSPSPSVSGTSTPGETASPNPVSSPSAS